MREKLLAFFIVLGIGMFIVGMGNGQNVRSKVTEPETPAERPIIISDIEPLKPLEEARVQFYHKKHVAKLKDAGCKTCHSYDAQKNQFDFQYPKDREKDNKRALINAYHNSCLGCHNERLVQGLPTGPIACGECHKPVSRKEWIKPVVFHYGLHYQHEKVTDKKCELCHHIYDEKEKKLVYKKGTESSCRDCHRQNDEKTRRSYRSVAHADCINCHIQRESKGEKCGPSNCEGCHVDVKLPAIKELTEIPRPDRKQPKSTTIKADGAGMPEVFFDHQNHEMNSLTCRTCHHETLEACKNCHTLKGSPEGNGISLEAAYHKENSSSSCKGCHERQKTQERCAGCHLVTRTQKEDKQFCAVCHTGPVQQFQPAPSLVSPETIIPDNAKAVMTISTLEQQYEPAKFPHLQIIKKLTEISNGNRLARHVHRQPATLCMGCHHNSPMESKSSPPACGNCHKPTSDAEDLSKPRLVAAYHLQCMGCHEKMKLEQKCTVCHAEKKVVYQCPSEQQKKQQ
jgi:hypothetical protein